MHAFVSRRAFVATSRPAGRSVNPSPSLLSQPVASRAGSHAKLDVARYPRPTSLRMTERDTPLENDSETDAQRNGSGAATPAAASANAAPSGTASTSGAVEAATTGAKPPLASFPLDAAATFTEEAFGATELVEELKDSASFGRRGEALFLAQAATLLLIFFPPMGLQGLLDLVGTLALTCGLVFIGYALVSLGRNLSPLPAPRARHRLVTSGMYGYVRHPMYGGLLLATFGLAAVTQSEARLALGGLLWWVLEQKVSFEERALLERYPDEYKEYCRSVKKFIPFVY